jgi:hypothetical protein
MLATRFPAGASDSETNLGPSPPVGRYPGWRRQPMQPSQGLDVLSGERMSGSRWASSA